MKAAFFQMGREEETNVLRQEAFDIWASVAEEANAKLRPGRLVGIVRSGDWNKDGIIDLKEFMKISENIVDEIEKSHNENLQEMIAEAQKPEAKHSKVRRRHFRNHTLQNLPRRQSPGAGRILHPIPSEK
jgi:hypothetical protein